MYRLGSVCRLARRCLPALVLAGAISAGEVGQSGAQRQTVPKADVNFATLTRTTVPYNPWQNPSRSEQVFLTIDTQICAVFGYGGLADAEPFAEWIPPTGEVFYRTRLNAGYWSYYSCHRIAGNDLGNAPGKWRFRIASNGVEMFSLPFEIREPENDAITIVTSPLLPNAASGKLYSTTLVAVGGQAPYEWSSKGLPDGMALSAEGVLAGTARVCDSYLLTITVKDSTGASSTRNFGLGVAAPAVTLQPAALTFISSAGGAAPAPRTVSVESNTGPLSFSWTTDAQAWLNVKTENLTPTKTQVTVNAPGTTTGTSNGTIRFVSSESPNVATALPVTHVVVAKGASLPAPGIISTYAGSAWTVAASGPATQAALGMVYGLRVDGNGALYFNDMDNASIRRVDADGTIAKVAGVGTPGFSGDGGAATEAAFNAPQDFAWNASGELCVADTNNYRVRCVASGGAIYTLGGIGSSGFSGDGGPAAYARLRATSLAADAAGNLYFHGDARLRKIDTKGVVTTIAGTGQAGFSGDGGPATDAAINPVRGNMAFDRSGNLYFTDTNNHRIRKIATDGVITTVAGTGTAGFGGDGAAATAARLNGPAGMAIDADGNLYFTDRNNHRVRRVDTKGIISTVAGGGGIGFSGDGGPAKSAALYYPTAVAVGADGQIWIADSLNFRIRRVKTDGSIETVAGNGMQKHVPDGTPATSAFLDQPAGISFDPAGNLYIADTATHRIRKVAPDGSFSTVAGRGISGGATNGPASEVLLYGPIEVLADRSGNVYFSDYYNNRVRKIGSDGNVTTIAGDGNGRFAGDGGPATRASLYRPNGLALDAAGNLYIADEANHCVRRVGTDGNISTFAGTGGSAGFTGEGGAAAKAKLSAPNGLAMDSKGNLLIADLGNRRVRRVGTDGSISTIAGNGTASTAGDGGAATKASLYEPSALAVDAAGNIYVAERTGHAVRRIGTDGMILTVAGGNGAGFSGDRGAATSAGLNLLSRSGLAVDAAGNLYISEGGNDRVRVVK